MNIYANPIAVAAPDLYAAAVAFIAAFARPVLPDGQIFRGWQNRGHLPRSTNDYAVVSIIDRARVGTNVRRYIPPASMALAGTLSELTLRDAQVQIDFCSDGVAATSRAECIHTVANGLQGAAFFNDYNIGCAWCDDVRTMDFTDGARQFVTRAVTILHLTYWSGVDAELPFFDAVITRLENVDVHHPRTEE